MEKFIKDQFAIKKRFNVFSNTLKKEEEEK